MIGAIPEKKRCQLCGSLAHESKIKAYWDHGRSGIAEFCPNRTFYYVKEYDWDGKPVLVKLV